MRDKDQFELADELTQAAELTAAATSAAREAREDVELAERYSAEGKPALAASMLLAAGPAVSRTMKETSAAAQTASVLF